MGQRALRRGDGLRRPRRGDAARLHHPGRGRIGSAALVRAHAQLARARLRRAAIARPRRRAVLGRRPFVAPRRPRPLEPVRRHARTLARRPRRAPGGAARHGAGVRPPGHLGARDPVGRRALGQARVQLLGHRPDRRHAELQRRDPAHPPRGSRPHDVHRLDAARRSLRAALPRHPSRRQDALDPLAVGSEERAARRPRSRPRRDDGRHRGVRRRAHAERCQRPAQARRRPRQDRELAPRPAHRPHALQRPGVRAARHGAAAGGALDRRGALVDPSRRHPAGAGIGRAGAALARAHRHGGPLPALRRHLALRADATRRRARRQGRADRLRRRRPRHHRARRAPAPRRGAGAPPRRGVARGRRRHLDDDRGAGRRRLERADVRALRPLRAAPSAVVRRLAARVDPSRRHPARPVRGVHVFHGRRPAVRHRVPHRCAATAACAGW